MGSILVRGLDQRTIERLTERARLNGRSLRQEVQLSLGDGDVMRWPSILGDGGAEGFLVTAAHARGEFPFQSNGLESGAKTGTARAV
jgi:antitoxin FitA-like protein